MTESNLENKAKDNNLPRRITANPYRFWGLVFCLAGAVFSPIAYFVVASVPLTAIGVSALIIGLTLVALANTRPGISNEACEMILRTGMENTAALLEELGLRNRAIYLPSTLCDGHLQSLIPLSDEKELSRICGKLPGRLIAKYGAGNDDIGIMFATPGSICLEMLESKPGPAASEITTAITYILTGLLDIANSVNVSLTDTEATVIVSGSRLHHEDIWYYRCLGSPVASIAAAIVSEALARPVRIKEEDTNKRKSLITLEILP